MLNLFNKSENGVSPILKVLGIVIFATYFWFDNVYLNNQKGILVLYNRSGHYVSNVHIEFGNGNIQHLSDISHKKNLSLHHQLSKHAHFCGIALYQK